MSKANPLLSPDAGADSPEEQKLDRSLRPTRLDEFIGQPRTREQLEIFIHAARKRAEALDHVLVFGPPGLGKTTLANIIAREMEARLRQTSGPVLEKAGDLAAILTNLEPNDVLFIDEIHRMSPAIEEILYPAMEDYRLDIMIGEGPAARSIKLDLPAFTLVGATTRAGLLTSPLRDRFGIVHRLQFYTIEELGRIVERSARLLKLSFDNGGVEAVAARSRGTPRIANRLLRRVRDYAEVRSDGFINRDVAECRAGHAGGRPVRSRRPGPQHAAGHHDQVRRRPGGYRQHLRSHRRGTRHDRGRGGALPDPAGIPHADPGAEWRPAMPGATWAWRCPETSPDGSRNWYRMLGTENDRRRTSFSNCSSDGNTLQRGAVEMATGSVYSLPVTINYEDTDAAGVVYYANYLPTWNGHATPACARRACP